MTNSTISVRTLTSSGFIQKVLGILTRVTFSPKSSLIALPVGKCTKNIKFAVLSDTHYYDPQLGTTGEAFQAHLAGDRKMLAESETILISALEAIKKSDAQFVLVCGDLTKDGEYICHQRFANYMSELTSIGKKVYVIDGNHDIYNPYAYSYSGSTQVRVRNTSPSDFKSLYRPYGYGQAIAVDPNSLSYVVEPIEGLRIIAMDSCIYDDNNTVQPTEGGLSTDRLTWIKSQIKDATSKGKTVMGMMHHGIVPHFSLKPTYFSEYLLTNYDQAAKELSSSGMKAVFTGHFHAQNVAEKIISVNNNYLIDIETGSLVTYPVPYRMVEMTSDFKKLKITSARILDSNYNTGGLDFQSYARKFTAQKIKEQFVQQFAVILRQAQPDLTLAQALEFAASLAAQQISKQITVSDLFVNAILAHYQGDEKPDAQTKAIYQNLASSTDPNCQVLGEFLLSIGADSYLADNTVTIDLTTGKPVINLLNAI